LVALGTLQWERDKLSWPSRRVVDWVIMAGQRTYLGSCPALLTLLPWFSFWTLKGDEEKEQDENGENPADP
jgi:hypothetical protein